MKRKRKFQPTQDETLADRLAALPTFTLMEEPSVEWINVLAKDRDELVKLLRRREPCDLERDRQDRNRAREFTNLRDKIARLQAQLDEHRPAEPSTP